MDNLEEASLHGAEAVCESCGAPAAAVMEDGYCATCGRRLHRTATERTGQVLSAGLAALSDRGLAHRTNQDRFGLREEEHAVLLVVCDGVSQSVQPETAAEAVVDAVLDGLSPPQVQLSAEEMEQQLRLAFGAAQSQLEAGSSGELDGPATTVVAALASGSTLVVAWAGDSRAYWKSADGLSCLTTDHVWEDAAAEGQISHAITRWIGPGAGESSLPEVVSMELPDEGGLLLLCTDGLWNYAPGDEAMRVLLDRCTGEDAAATAEQLVAWALERGGDDNITAAVWQCGAQSGKAAAR